MTGASFLHSVFSSNATIVVEAAFGADLTAAASTWSWTDITSDVMEAGNGGVQITQGRQDENSQASPASCSFTLLNSTGKYTPFNGASTLYPNVKRNTPVRVRLVFDSPSWDVTRFFGYMSSITPAWDESANLATVAIVANGTLRRLGQGRTPLRSPLYRAVTTTDDLLTYWPLEDASGATQANASTAGNSPLVVNGGVTFNPGSGAPGTSGSASIPPAAYLRGNVPEYTDTNFWAVNVWTKMPVVTAPQVEMVVAKWYTEDGSWTLSALWLSSTNLAWGWNLNWLDKAGTGHNWDTRQAFVGTSFGSDINPFDGNWNSITFTAEKSGSDLRGHLWVNGKMVMPTTVSGRWSGKVSTFELGDAEFSSLTQINYTADQEVSSLSVWTDASSDWRNSVEDPLYNPGIGWSGETATDRLTRLCGEESISLNITGSSSITMGAQTVATFVDLIRECETADGGLLYDGLSAGLGYVCLSSRYNSTPGLLIDESDAPALDAPFGPPIYDDQRNRNDVTVSRPGGTSARYIDSTGPLGTSAIGTYDDSVTTNLETDEGLINQASWRVHLGTVNGMRYPNLSLDMQNENASALWQQVLNISVSSQITVANITSAATQMPIDDIMLTVEGWTEFLSPHDWTITYTCSPFDPYRVVVVGDTEFGRLELNGQNLASGVNSSATSWSVNSPNLPLLTTKAAFPADFPYLALCEGEIVQVTDTTGSSSPQTVTVVRSINATTSMPVRDYFARTFSSGWGNTDTGQTWSNFGPNSEYNVTGGFATMSLASVGSTRQTMLNTVSLADLDVVIPVKTGVLASGSYIGAAIMIRRIDASNYYYATLRFFPGASIDVAIVSVVAGVETDLAAKNAGLTHVAANLYNLRIRAAGTSLMAKGWEVGTTEPTDWTVAAADSSLTAANPIGLRGVLPGTNTNTLPVTLSWGNLSVVTRTLTAGTGVSKSHNSGALLSLYRPSAIAL